jgi:predicted MFS family arabinose efflux permease
MRRPNYSWAILAVGFSILFFSGGSRFAFGLMLKPMSEELDVSRSTLSLAVTMFMVVSALAMPFVGRLVDRWSLRGTIAIGAVIGAAGLALMGQVQSSWQVFLVYGVVYALGNSGTSIAPVVVMVSQWFVERRGFATSVAVSGNAIGQLVIVAALASALAAIGWQASYTVLAVVNAAILLPLILLVVRPGPPLENAAASATSGSEAAPQPLTLRQALASRPFLLLLAIYTICGFQDFFVATHIVAFAQDQGVGDVLAGNLLAWMGVMGLLGVLLAGVMADAVGASRPTALCFLMRIGIFALIIPLQSTPAILAFGLLYGFTFLITAPLTVVFLGNIYGPNRLGTLTGTVSMIHQIMGGLGALTGGWIFDQTGSYNAAFILMLSLSLAATVLTLAVREPLRRHRIPLGATAC